MKELLIELDKDISLFKEWAEFKPSIIIDDTLEKIKERILKTLQKIIERDFLLKNLDI